MGYDMYSGRGCKKWKTLSPTDVINELGMRTNKDGVQVPMTTDNLKLLVQQEACN